MKIGDKIRLTPESIQPKKNSDLLLEPQTATVVYIHPKGRFYVVRFPAGYRESFSDR